MTARTFLPQVSFPNLSMALARRSEPSALVKTEDRRLRATTEQERQFAEWYIQLFPRLCDYAARAIGRAQAKDVVQDAFSRLWQRWPIIVLDRPGPAYFFHAVRNAVVDSVHQGRHEAVARVLDVEIENLPGGVIPDARLLAEEQARTLEAAIARMPARIREAWILIRDNGCSYEKAAEIMGVERSTVKATIARGHTLVREAMTDAGYLAAARKPRALPPPPPPPPTTEGNQP